MKEYKIITKREEKIIVSKIKTNRNFKKQN